MEKYEKALDKFLSEYKNKDYFEGAILCGSYATGNFNEDSDIDLHIFISNNEKWRKRGNKVVDGFLIEYFINPLKKSYEYLERDFKSMYFIDGSMYGFGKVLYDVNGNVEKLRDSALSYFDKEFDAIGEVELKLKKYAAWDKMDELKSKIKNNENYELSYYLLFQGLIDLYYSNNRLAKIPLTKLEKIYKEDNFRKRFKLKNMPNDNFIELVINCLDNKKFYSIEKLYDYVIADAGGFNIENFELISKVD